MAYQEKSTVIKEILDTGNFSASNNVLLLLGELHNKFLRQIYINEISIFTVGYKICPSTIQPIQIDSCILIIFCKWLWKNSPTCTHRESVKYSLLLSSTSNQYP